MPLQFEPNRGQTDARVAYLAHGPGYTVYLTASEAVLGLYAPAPQPQGAPLLPDRLPLSWFAPALPPPAMPITPSAVLHLSLVGANPQAAPMGQAQLPGEVNYLYGTDPSGWLTHLPTFAEVDYPNVYPGIDLVYHGRQQQLEYDFNLQPGADPNLVRLQVSGAQSVALDGNGNLALQAGGATLVQAQPTVYQEISGQRVSVDAHYTLLGGGQVGFTLGSYDSGQPLVIDPVLDYSTYLGGTGTDDAYGIAVDSAGSAYITGYSTSTNFPVAGGTPYQGQNGGGDDVFISKLNPRGSALVYSTYLGGSGGDVGYGIAVDSGGNAYVTGSTLSTNFPTANAVQAHLAGTENAFISKLNANGSALVYSTYLGGRSYDAGNGIAVDSGGNAYVTGTTQSTNFPTVNALQSTLSGSEDAFVSKLNPAGSALTYSTYLGGSNTGYGNGIAVDSGGNAYVAGITGSTNFPTVNALQAHLAGTENAFVSKLNPTGSALLYSTYLGGNSSDSAAGIAVDGSGSAYVIGTTESSNFPTANALQAHLVGTENAFVSKLNANGSALVYSTYLGSFYASGAGIVVDGGGDAYVAGDAGSPDFPIVNAVQPNPAGGDEAFVSKLNSAGSALDYSTYLGGTKADRAAAVAVDRYGNAYVVGLTNSYDFPTVNALQPYLSGSVNAFVAKIGTTSGNTPWHPHFKAQFAAG
ncbi:MAG TPA: SBBP repeat-containing protein, partial [Chloroflexota bacterium]|nr:SBBP repeat-containing protein [Chloroflexota bacterium]